jgi:transcriptional regulator with XRE-family HTH domain
VTENKEHINYKKLHYLINVLGLEFPVAELSRKTAYSDATISPYVSGKVKPSTRFLQKICEVYNVNLDGFENQYLQPESLHIASGPEEKYGLEKENLDLKKEIKFKDEQIVFYKDKIEFLENKIYDLELGNQKKQNGTN